jgi:hypothetical protein
VLRRMCSPARRVCALGSRHIFLAMCGSFFGLPNVGVGGRRACSSEPSSSKVCATRTPSGPCSFIAAARAAAMNSPSHAKALLQSKLVPAPPGAAHSRAEARASLCRRRGTNVGTVLPGGAWPNDFLTVHVVARTTNFGENDVTSKWRQNDFASCRGNRTVPPWDLSAYIPCEAARVSRKYGFDERVRHPAEWCVIGRPRQTSP